MCVGNPHWAAGYDSWLLLLLATLLGSLAWTTTTTTTLDPTYPLTMPDAVSGTAPDPAPAPAAAAKPRGGKMLFVSRLPYSITTDLLNEYFGDVGPLRKAFVVTDKETKQSKGVAYVQYALADDADRAMETLGNKPIPGTDGPPRPIRIE